MTDQEHIEYRKKHFALEAKRVTDEDGDCIKYSITTNGYQWTSEMLRIDEIRQMIKLFESLLEKL